MRVAIFHNRYRQRGGEDTAVDFEVELLRKAQHEVHLVTVDNREEIAGALGAARAGLRARWNPATVERVNALLDRTAVDVAHVHNFFPSFTPALHVALKRRGVPVVQTLHNYRLLCANGMLLREGAPCEQCVTRGPWNAVLHGCYRGSRLATAAWADSTSYHRRLGTWRDCVDLFAVPSDFARRKLLAAGLPAARVRVVPYPVVDPGVAPPGGEGAVYVGRLSAEKGVDLLLDAWRDQGGAPLTIVGDGPDAARLRARGASIAGVHFTGALPHDRALVEMARAAFVVVPSRWYEIFPFAVLEAMGRGRAVVASHPTALSEMVDHGTTGLLFERGSVADLSRTCAALLADTHLCAALGAAARECFELRLGAEAGLERLERLLGAVASEEESPSSRDPVY